MRSKVSAVCPCSISFIFRAFLPDFKIQNDKISDYKYFGSTGVGFTIDRNIQVTVSASRENSCFFNKEKISIPTVLRAIKIISSSPLRISIESFLPIGSGFGISGGATIASLYAVNELFTLKKTNAELHAIAHYSEIVEKTGLGTVATQTTGGFLIKKRAGIPSLFKRLDFSGKIIYATVIGSLKTPLILSNPLILKKINKEADAALNEISKKKNLIIEDVIDISYRYCLKSGLMKNSETRKIIEQVRNSGGSATMAILGNTVLSNVKPKQTKYPVFDLQISNNKIQIVRNANR